jgi:hypothetical protein
MTRKHHLPARNAFFRRQNPLDAPTGIFQVEAISIQPYETERSACTLNASTALALYREWLSIPGVECVQITRPILHSRWGKWNVESRVAPLQYGFNEVHVVAHWRVIKGFYSQLYRQRYAFARNW